jgi:hypothetical protein
VGGLADHVPVGWRAAALFAPAFLLDDRGDGAVQFVRRHGVPAEEHGERRFAGGEGEGVAGEQPGRGAPPAVRGVLEGCWSAGGDPRACQAFLR